jgi:hypothetical protein
MQQVLLDRTAHESAHAVRRALANCIAAAAKHSVPSGQWPGLLEFLHHCSQAGSAEHKEVALLLYAALFETVGRCWPATARAHVGSSLVVQLTCWPQLHMGNPVHVAASPVQHMGVLLILQLTS